VIEEQSAFEHAFPKPLSWGGCVGRGVGGVFVGCLPRISRVFFSPIYRRSFARAERGKFLAFFLSPPPSKFAFSQVDLLSREACCDDTLFLQSFCLGTLFRQRPQSPPRFRRLDPKEALFSGGKLRFYTFFMHQVPVGK